VTNNNQNTVITADGATVDAPNNYELIPLTALNALNIICESMVQNTKTRQNTVVDFPSLWQLAFKIYHAPMTTMVARNIKVRER